MTRQQHSRPNSGAEIDGRRIDLLLNRTLSILVTTLATPMFGAERSSKQHDGSLPTGSVLCLLPLFCSQYERITAELNSSRFRLELGILSATAWDISTECPQGQLHLPDAEMLDAIEAMYKPGKGNCKFCEPKTSRINAIKLWYLGLVQYDMIFYMDLDIDVARVVPSQVLNSVLTFHRLPVAIAAAADWASPINTGIMLFRPSATRYRQMLKLLKTGIFDGSTFNGTGFGRVGRPKQLLSGPLPSNYMSTRMFTHDSWDTVSGDSDQGFFTW
eukprot:CAMPEP_0113277380 /NCGR_PEP_ID=MMETSP0008_2-20120614/26015_1 /TAXON_ID=97485 /ORGANISM="Prymnesium parvum" /LENGTH=272 /DNA_ID=CAMNT_0000127283 /DNA_START=166 /DNA_END=981 /DNA_ORIENTATION=- /assembly_acc=CAM_ASM_000153